jgi:hypothetical protein
MNVFCVIEREGEGVIHDESYLATIFLTYIWKQWRGIKKQRK